MKNTSTSAHKTQSSRDVVDFPSPSSRAHKHAAPNQDFEFECESSIPPLIPDGIYDVVFLHCEKKFLWGAEKLFLWFQILTDGDYHGEKVYMACNGPREKKWGISSKFFQAWVIASERRPDRFDHNRMSTKVFKGKVFAAKIRRVTRNAKGHAHADMLQYSIIDVLLTLQTCSTR